MYSKPPKKGHSSQTLVFHRAPMAARFKKTTEQAPTICAIEQHLQMVWPTMSKLSGFNDIATYKQHSKSVFFSTMFFLNILRYLKSSGKIFQCVPRCFTFAQERPGNNKCFKGIWGQAKTVLYSKVVREKSSQNVPTAFLFETCYFSRTFFKRILSRQLTYPLEKCWLETSLSFWNGPFSGEVRALSEGS